MSLQERTIVVRNFDPDRTTELLLKELCLQVGPVRKVVMRPDHAFVEYDDVDSVGYSKALLDGVELFGRPLSFEPKIRLNKYLYYTDKLNEYVDYDRRRRTLEQQQQQQHQQQRQLHYQQQMRMLMQQQQLPHPQQPIYQPPPQMIPYNNPHPHYQPPPPNGFY